MPVSVLYLNRRDRNLPPSEPPGDVRKKAVFYEKPQDRRPRGRLQAIRPLSIPDFTCLSLIVDAVAASS